MSIYVIGDLHLSFSVDKPMDIFGNNWEDHAEKIKNSWIEKVKEDDTVILPGDFSWATYIKDAYLDFLSSGGSDYPLNILKKVNVDMTSEEPILKAIKMFEDKLSELKKLID